MKHSHEILDLTASFVVVAMLAWVLLRRRYIVLSWYELLNCLIPFQLSGLSSYLNAESSFDAALWERSNGRRGLYRRWRNRVVLLRLCQLHLAEESIHRDRVVEMTRVAAQLTEATAIALLLSFLRPLNTKASDAAAFKALRLYARLADQVYLFVCTNDSEAFSFTLCSLL